MMVFSVDSLGITAVGRADPRGRTNVQIAWPLWVRVFKCLAQAHSNDSTGKCRELDPSIRNWENTARKELHPFELTSKVTTEFAYNGTSSIDGSRGWLNGLNPPYIFQTRFLIDGSRHRFYLNKVL